MANITKRSGTYRFRVSMGYDLTGKQIFRSTTWAPPAGMSEKQEKKEAQRQAVLFEERCRTGLTLSGSTTFADFVEVWRKNYAEKELKAKTYEGYCLLLRRILPAIGHIRLDRLQPHHLLEFYDNLEDPGIRENISYRCRVDLSALLKEKKLTKAHTAGAAGVSIRTVYTVAAGESVRRVSAEAIAAALGMKPEALFAPVGTGKQLSGKYRRHYHRLISAILTTAVQWQVIPANPCDRVKAPRVERKEARYLDEVQAGQLLEALQDEQEQYRAMITLLLYTGLRRGELCGLEWDDVDFERKLLHVRRNSLYLPSRGVYSDSTKTNSSNRVLRISDEAIRILQEHRRQQNANRLALGDRWEDSGRLFTQWNGRPIFPDTISRWFRQFVQRKELPPCNIHSLRHTNATLQIAAHVPITTVQKRLGHAQQSTTGNIYAHAIRSADEAAAEVLEDILRPSSGRGGKP